ncbi:MAG: histidine kinase [Bacteriovoracaceae bacterium]|jgi:ETFB lysine methyltransferase|nr:histidine kinase [Bacteriovoracaceae bacterium]
MIDPLRYRYQTVEIGDMEIHIRSLRDILDFHHESSMAQDADICDTQFPLFGVLWPSSLILAEVMLTRKIKNLNILEVGCGLALPSILLSLRGASIKVTDNHPSVATFLTENIRINQCEPIPFIHADWENGHELPEREQFDLIIGSDVLYQRDDSADLSNFINLHSRQKCEVIIVDPNRGNQKEFKKQMKAIGFAHSKDERIFYDEFQSKLKGSVHYYSRL